jgi:hypothetical protein
MHLDCFVPRNDDGGNGRVRLSPSLPSASAVCRRKRRPPFSVIVPTVRHRERSRRLTPSLRGAKRRSNPGAYTDSAGGVTAVARSHTGAAPASEAAALPRLCEERKRRGNPGAGTDSAGGLSFVARSHTGAATASEAAALPRHCEERKRRSNLCAGTAAAGGLSVVARSHTGAATASEAAALPPSLRGAQRRSNLCTYTAPPRHCALRLAVTGWGR